MLIVLSRSWEMSRSNCSDTEDSPPSLTSSEVRASLRLESHQLAHEVDEGVELVARDPDRAGGLAPLLHLLQMLLLYERRFHLGLGDELLLDEHLAELLLRPERLAKGPGGQDLPRSSEDVPEPLGLALVATRARERCFELRLILHEYEDVPDRVLVRGSRQQHFPPGIAGFGLHRAEGRDVLHVGKDVGLAERGEFLDQIEHLRAVLEDIPRGPEAYSIGPGLEALGPSGFPGVALRARGPRARARRAGAFLENSRNFRRRVSFSRSISSGTPSSNSMSRRRLSRPLSASPMTSFDIASVPERQRSRTVSISCANLDTASKPNIAADPLMVCMALKAALMISPSRGCDSELEELLFELRQELESLLAEGRLEFVERLRHFPSR